MIPENIEAERDRSTAMFRILQETLTNVARHAKASHVVVELKKDQRLLLLEVKDNGRGISVQEAASTKSFGLLGMRERALLFGGEVTIQGREGEGTTVRVRIPL
jgi:signal transduction histidine kinase